MAETFEVTVERGRDGWWVASVPAVQGCHTQGRTIDQALTRIINALDVCGIVATRGQLIPNVRLPRDLREAVTRTLRARDRAADARSTARQELASSVAKLTAQGISTRDAARLLGISHQRVQQVARAAS